MTPEQGRRPDYQDPNEFGRALRGLSTRFGLRTPAKNLHELTFWAVRITDRRTLHFRRIFLDVWTEITIDDINNAVDGIFPMEKVETPHDIDVIAAQQAMLRAVYENSLDIAAAPDLFKRAQEVMIIGLNAHFES